MSWKLCAAVIFTGGTPAIGSDTLPSGVTVRRLPRRSLIKNLPSGRNAIAHGSDELVRDRLGAVLRLLLRRRRLGLARERGFRLRLVGERARRRGERRDYEQRGGELGRAHDRALHGFEPPLKVP